MRILRRRRRKKIAALAIALLALVFLGALIGIGTKGLLSPSSAAWTLGYLPTLLVAAVAATPIGARIAKTLSRFRWFEPARLFACVVLFALCVASLASQSYNPFIYFRF